MESDTTRTDPNNSDPYNLIGPESARKTIAVRCGSRAFRGIEYGDGSPVTLGVPACLTIAPTDLGRSIAVGYGVDPLTQREPCRP